MKFRSSQTFQPSHSTTFWVSSKKSQKNSEAEHSDLAVQTMQNRLLKQLDVTNMQDWGSKWLN